MSGHSGYQRWVPQNSKTFALSAFTSGTPTFSRDIFVGSEARFQTRLMAHNSYRNGFIMIYNLSYDHRGDISIYNCQFRTSVLMKHSRFPSSEIQHLPIQEWNSDMDVAWNWFWDRLEHMLMDRKTLQPGVGRTGRFGSGQLVC